MMRARPTTVAERAGTARGTAGRAAATLRSREDGAPDGAMSRRDAAVGEDGAPDGAVSGGDEAAAAEGDAPAPRARRRRGRRTPHLRAVPAAGSHPPRFRIRKLRVFAILLGLGALAVVSTVFGMMMAVTSDLPRLEEPAMRNSVLVDRKGRRLGLLTGTERRIFVRAADIAPVMKQAVIAVEDRRFYTNDGIDVRGIGRALYQDIIQQRIVQGGSTITQQFVKNALAAQDERTVFQKLREAALAFQITRKWSKERILRNYLNTIYFGNGAYGIESAAKTYFGSRHPGCGEPGQRRCAAQLDLEEAALLAGIVASPSGYDPLLHPPAAAARRDLVLDRMAQQGFISEAQRAEASAQSLPTRSDIQPPAEDTAQPYFTSWIKQQVVDRLGGGQEGARLAFEGGLTVRTTLDTELQAAAQLAVDRTLPYTSGPRAALVALENRSGEVLAMVGGDDYRTQSFNLATQGQRQPGSAFKPFVLAQALKEGISANSVWESRKRAYCIKPMENGGCRDFFEVNNYEDAYAGLTTLARATTFSDNAVYANLGIQLGTRKIATMARRLGIRTPVSRNLAMILGGLRQGVTPLDMAHAYETFARGGKLTFGTLSPGAPEQGKRVRTPVPGTRRPQDDRPPRRRPAAADRAAERREGAERAARAARALARGGGAGDLAPDRRRPERDRGAGADPRRLRGGQDRHDGELRRRVVRRLDARDHGRRVGRLPGRAAPDGDGVRRRAGGRRDLPGAHLQGLRRAGGRPRLRQAGGGRRAGRARDPRDARGADHVGHARSRRARAGARDGRRARSRRPSPRPSRRSPRRPRRRPPRSSPRR